VCSNYAILAFDELVHCYYTEGLAREGATSLTARTPKGAFESRPFALFFRSARGVVRHHGQLSSGHLCRVARVSSRRAGPELRVLL
jgi:hypothetical protein